MRAISLPHWNPMHMPGTGVGNRLPRIGPSAVPHTDDSGLVRYATVVRNAPQNASQAVAGLGAFTTENRYTNFLPMGDDPQPGEGVLAMPAQATPSASPSIWDTLNSALASPQVKALIGAGATVAPKPVAKAAPSNMTTYAIVAGVAVVGFMFLKGTKGGRSRRRR